MLRGGVAIAGRSAGPLVARRRRWERRSRTRTPTPACVPAAGSVDAANSAVGHGGLVTTSAATDETGFARIATTPLVASFQAAATGGSLTFRRIQRWLPSGFCWPVLGLWPTAGAHCDVHRQGRARSLARARPMTQARIEITPEGCISCPKIGFPATLVDSCCQNNATYTCTPSAYGVVRGLWQPARDSIRTDCGRIADRFCVVLAGGHNVGHINNACSRSR